MINYNCVLIGCGEIALKGPKTRSHYEKFMISNIKDALDYFNIKSEVIKRDGRLIVETDKVQEASKILLRVFGIEWLSPALKIKLKDLEGFIIERAKDLLNGANSFKLEINRVGKHDFTSLDLAKKLGDLIRRALNVKVDLKKAERTIYIEIRDEDSFIFLNKFRGYGGLPYGVSGKVLSLISGGIDSPVASFLMMKRGCKVNFLHFHSFRKGKEALDEKMGKILTSLAYPNLKFEAFFVPSFPFEVEVIKVPQGYRNILFRRFMLRVGEILASKIKAKGLVLGDSLAQVASQTLDSLYALDEAINLPIFRPLIGFNKEEIVNLAKIIGTYEFSIKDYKDCCSLIGRKPNTRPNLEKVKEYENLLNLDKIIKDSLSLIEVYHFFGEEITT
ncbi:putative tRNA sulfurtransferase [archaeon HR06]|nr:putative tRNA sulfurtransferase [archaeon HR06]